MDVILARGLREFKVAVEEWTWESGVRKAGKPVITHPALKNNTSIK